MRAKLLMNWNVRSDTESEYFEFLVHEFIPGLTKLGITDIQVWYTAYGNGEQKLASGIASSSEQMRQILSTDVWRKLCDKLNSFVDDYRQKVITATGGFQI